MYGFGNFWLPTGVQLPYFAWHWIMWNLGFEFILAASAATASWRRSLLQGACCERRHMLRGAHACGGDSERRHGMQRRWNSHAGTQGHHQQVARRPPRQGRLARRRPARCGPPARLPFFPACCRSCSASHQLFSSLAPFPLVWSWFWDQTWGTSTLLSEDSLALFLLTFVQKTSTIDVWTLHCQHVISLVKLLEL